MSVTIRLARIGKRNAPSYKIVVANTRDKRNGRYLDILGHYNPSVIPAQFSLDEEKYQKWTENGALVTEAVVKLRDGTYEYLKYEGSGAKKKDKKAEEVAEETAENVVEESVEEEKQEEEPEEEI